MKRRILRAFVCVAGVLGIGTQMAYASVPAAVSEHIVEVAQWAYRGGTTRSYPSCGSTCGALWTAEHAPSETDPFAIELWREMQQLRERVEVLPRLGSLVTWHSLDRVSPTVIGVKMGTSPSHVIWLKLVLPPASPPVARHLGAWEPDHYEVDYNNAGASVGGVRLERGAWVLAGRESFGGPLIVEFQEQCGSGEANMPYIPPVGNRIQQAYGAAGCWPFYTRVTSPVYIWALESPVASPSEDFTSQTAPTTVLFEFYVENPGERTVQEAITRQLELHADEYRVLIKWLDAHLGGSSTDPLDMEAMLYQHEPQYRFDEGEDFLPQVVTAFTDNYVLDGEGNYALEDANQLNTGTSTLRAAAGSPGTGMLPQALRLELLGEHYHDGTNDLSASEDTINARGNEVPQYEEDVTRMRGLGYGEVIYARAVTDPDDGKVWLQYWEFYYDNSWRWSVSEVGQHEGDWEMTQVGLNAVGEPDAMTFARHEASRTWGCTWEAVEKTGEEEEQPVVYPGRGSHASYPHEGTTEIGYLQDDNHDGRGAAVQPGLHMLASEDDWMNWNGRWGASTGTFSSPATPSRQGDKWSRPSSFQNDHLTPGDCGR